jgi:hypothetical protein
MYLILCALFIILPSLGIKWPVRPTTQPATSIEKYTRKDRSPATPVHYFCYVAQLDRREVLHCQFTSIATLQNYDMTGCIIYTYII